MRGLLGGQVGEMIGPSSRAMRVIQNDSNDLAMEDCRLSRQPNEDDTHRCFA
jgi:hypothetical protein